MLPSYDASIWSWAEEEGRGAFPPVWRPAELRHLVTLRQAVASGRRNEETLDSLRLHFVRWLYQRGRLGTDDTDELDDAQPNAA